MPSLWLDVLEVQAAAEKALFIPPPSFLLGCLLNPFLKHVKGALQ